MKSDYKEVKGSIEWAKRLCASDYYEATHTTINALKEILNFGVCTADENSFDIRSLLERAQRDVRERMFSIFSKEFLQLVLAWENSYAQDGVPQGLSQEKALTFISLSARLLLSIGKRDSIDIKEIDTTDVVERHSKERAKHLVIKKFKKSLDALDQARFDIELEDKQGAVRDIVNSLRLCLVEMQPHLEGIVPLDLLVDSSDAKIIKILSNPKWSECVKILSRWYAEYKENERVRGDTTELLFTISKMCDLLSYISFSKELQEYTKPEKHVFAYEEVQEELNDSRTLLNLKSYTHMIEVFPHLFKALRLCLIEGLSSQSESIPETASDLFSACRGEFSIELVKMYRHGSILKLLSWEPMLAQGEGPNVNAEEMLYWVDETDRLSHIIKERLDRTGRVVVCNVSEAEESKIGKFDAYEITTSLDKAQQRLHRPNVGRMLAAIEVLYAFKNCLKVGTEEDVNVRVMPLEELMHLCDIKFLVSILDAYTAFPVTNLFYWESQLMGNVEIAASVEEMQYFLDTTRMLCDKLKYRESTSKPKVDYSVVEAYLCAAEFAARVDDEEYSEVSATNLILALRRCLILYLDLLGFDDDGSSISEMLKEYEFLEEKYSMASITKAVNFIATLESDNNSLKELNPSKEDLENAISGVRDLITSLKGEA